MALGVVIGVVGVWWQYGTGTGSIHNELSSVLVVVSRGSSVMLGLSFSTDIVSLLESKSVFAAEFSRCDIVPMRLGES